MSCTECESNEVVVPIRVGNREIGFGNVLIIGCRAHATMAWRQWKIGSQTDVNVLPGPPFQCAACGETFNSVTDWTDKDAQEEYERIFGRPVDTQRLVCDDCHARMLATMPPDATI